MVQMHGVDIGGLVVWWIQRLMLGVTLCLLLRQDLSLNLEVGWQSTSVNNPPVSVSYTSLGSQT